MCRLITRRLKREGKSNNTQHFRLINPNHGNWRNAGELTQRGATLLFGTGVGCKGIRKLCPRTKDGTAPDTS